ncbi:hypothetical protein M406DRAFT_71627 [Cryphonectria parasitica EP155]|uniref:Uncharacterized protein n=1 Tax=Cryphonectria parasitica (strain ATCC 38755 / EP155) TaxID=660469 RepID=A0A9P4Y8V8_CRYP1|nr:uncharacterized protein M406DRAFT_71627 [Cryphonectria parasitica EP155]KAF3768641.1 hypothetical protein M406DRAFT_71627 [Cryphonectria parasitica EP155]
MILLVVQQAMLSPRTLPPVCERPPAQFTSATHPDDEYNVQREQNRYEGLHANIHGACTYKAPVELPTINHFSKTLREVETSKTVVSKWNSPWAATHRLHALRAVTPSVPNRRIHSPSPSRGALLPEQALHSTTTTPPQGSAGVTEKAMHCTWTPSSHYRPEPSLTCYAHRQIAPLTMVRSLKVSRPDRHVIITLGVKNRTRSVSMQYCFTTRGGSRVIRVRVVVQPLDDISASVPVILSVCYYDHGHTPCSQIQQTQKKHITT